MFSQYCIAFWNVENLFDVENSILRTEKIQRVVGSAIKGWTKTKLNKKIAQLAAIIKQMNTGRGPDLLGVCEVENRYVLELLVKALAPLKRQYGIAHVDTQDSRGIDVAFIFDKTLFTADKVFSHFIVKRNATRDLVQVNFITAKGRMLVVVGNHWPSRLGEDDSKSESYRAIAGETLAYFHERILEELGETTPVLAMGDFNDEPFNTSLVDYALSQRSKTSVLNARNSTFLNLMWPLLGQNLGTHYYGNDASMFDQFLANKNLLLDVSPIKILPESSTIVRFPEMVKSGSYPGPIPYGGMGKDINPKGFSDHFPIQVTLVETD